MRLSFSLWLLFDGDHCFCLFRVELFLREVQKILDGIQFLNRQDLIKRIRNDFVYLYMIGWLYVVIREFVSSLI